LETEFDEGKEISAILQKAKVSQYFELR